jgi:hypothetical protein
MSSESSEEEHDPEMAQIMKYEETLKSRIFLADRFEKMEKVLINLNLVSKDTNFCSDFELSRFKEEMDKEETQ